MSQVDKEKAPHPGKILKEQYMDPRGMSGRMLSNQLGLHPARINDIVLKRRGITPDTALKLSELFGTTPEYWLYMQADYDLLQVKKNSNN